MTLPAVAAAAAPTLVKLFQFIVNYVTQQSDSATLSMALNLVAPVIEEFANLDQLDRAARVQVMRRLDELLRTIDL